VPRKRLSEVANRLPRRGAGRSVDLLCGWLELQTAILAAD
jgi:hypothetical protein